LTENSFRRKQLKRRKRSGRLNFIRKGKKELWEKKKAGSPLGIRNGTIKVYTLQMNQWCMRLRVKNNLKLPSHSTLSMRY
jgi:hypothetical protein